MRNLLFVLFVILFFSCTENRPTIISGHPYTHVIQNKTYTPQKGDLIWYHITYRKDNEIISSSYQEGELKRFRIPETDPANDKFDRVSPITEALLLMSEGDSMMLELKVDLLEQMPVDAKKGESKFFGLKMVEIKSAQKIKEEEDKVVEEGKEQTALLIKRMSSFKKNNNQKLQNLKSGIIQYEWNKKGEGEAIKNNDVVFIHFLGHVLESKKQFMNTFKNKKVYEVPLGRGRVIEAWEEIIPTLSVGDKITLFVPYKKAYGAAGSPGLGIPEKSDLVFYMEIVGIK